MQDLLLFSDLHVHPHNWKSDEYPATRILDDCFDVLHTMFKLAQEKQAILLFGGDLYHTLAGIAKPIQVRLIRTFLALTELYPDVVMYSISGNHDYGNLSALKGETWKTFETTALSPIESLSDVLPNVACIDFQNLEVGGWIIEGLPYLKFKSDMNKVIESLFNKQISNEDLQRRILLMHNTPKMFGTYEFDFEDPRLLSTFKYVFCGHIHEPKKVSENGYLIGNPKHQDAQDFGERGYWHVQHGKAPAFCALDYPEYPHKSRVAQDKEENVASSVYKSDSIPEVLQEFLKDTHALKRLYLTAGMRYSDVHEELPANLLFEIDGELSDDKFSILAKKGGNHKILHTVEFPKGLELGEKRQILKTTIEFYKELNGL